MRARIRIGVIISFLTNIKVMAGSVHDVSTEVPDFKTCLGESTSAELPNTTTFSLIHQAYFSAKAKDAVDPHDIVVKEYLGRNETGMTVPIRIGYGSHGRGLFLTEPVKKDQVIRNNARMGIFRTGRQWRDFLSLLPSKLQRDVTVWAYVMEWDEDSPFVVGLDLDEGSLINHGPARPDEVTPASSANLFFQGTDDETGELRAARDMEAGEELLCDYYEFLTLDHDLSWYEYRHLI